MNLQRRVLVGLLGLLFFTACRDEASDSSSNSFDEDLKQISYLALGDSYTIGTGLKSGQAYPWLLADYIESHGKADSVALQVVAENGWTTADLRQGITKAAPDSAFDLVTLLIGVNNQYEKRSLTEYRQQYSALLRYAIIFAEGDTHRVLALSIPDWGQSPAGQGRRAQISREIDQFNQVNRAIADSLGVTYVDLTTISRRAAQEPGLIAPDGLHFSADMHVLWADAIAPELPEWY